MYSSVIKINAKEKERCSFRYCLLLSAIGYFLVSIFLGAQQTSETPSQSDQMLKGNIEAFRHIQRERHEKTRLETLIKVQSDNRIVVAELGPKADLDDLNLRKGDSITLVGEFLESHQLSPIFIAKKIQINGQVRNLNTSDLFTQNQSMSQETPQTTPSANGNITAHASASPAEVRMIFINATNSKFIPHEIEANRGEKINIQLRNSGDVPHSIEFKFPYGQFGLGTPVEPGATGSFIFTAPNTSNNYLFYCPLQGQNSNMKGYLIVK